MDTKHALIGLDGVVEFGECLNTLHETGHKNYSFEMLDASGRLATCSLDEVISEFQNYVDFRRVFFRVRITYIDRQLMTIGSTEKEFKRVSK